MIHPIKSLQARYHTLVLKNFTHTHHARYLRKIHNTHLGESCFIIGNGPSLSAEDLTVLHKNGIHSFAVNRIYKIFDQTSWLPTYYVNTDAVMIRDFLPEVNAMPVKDKFIPLQNRFYLGAQVKGAHHFFRNDTKDVPGYFSLDCTEQVNIRGTVTITCMQLAIHMGYRHIYLLGVDHNFDKIITETGEIIIDPSVKNYFCEGYDNDVSTEVQHNLGKTTRSYMDMKEFIDKNDVHIYNASRQTKLEVFPRVTFEQALQDIKERNAHGK